MNTEECKADGNSENSVELTDFIEKICDSLEQSHMQYLNGQSVPAWKVMEELKKKYGF